MDRVKGNDCQQIWSIVSGGFYRGSLLEGNWSMKCPHWPHDQEYTLWPTSNMTEPPRCVQVPETEQGNDILWYWWWNVMFSFTVPPASYLRYEVLWFRSAGVVWRSCSTVIICKPQCPLWHMELIVEVYLRDLVCITSSQRALYQDGCSII
jgi:hypothetical protein